MRSKIERAFAMGEAVGAATSIALGSRWPQRIDKAVLINIPYFSDADTAKNDIADIAKVRPSDESGFPAPRSIKFLLENDPEHAPMQPTQSWMDRINTAQLEIGRDRWQAMGALSKFDTLGGMAALKLPVLMLYGENFIYGKHRALMQAKCPHAKLEIVPGGRFCMSWERATDIAGARPRLPGLTAMSRDAIGRLNDALSRFGRVGLCTLPTPLEPMTRLSRHLAARDCGSSARTAPAPALAATSCASSTTCCTRPCDAGVDTLVSGGVVQSNSQRQVAAAAAKLGLDCHLAVYHGRLAPPSAEYGRTGNALLNRLFGATLHDVPWNGDRNGAIRDLPIGCRPRAARPMSCPTASPIPGRRGLCLDRGRDRRAVRGAGLRSRRHRPLLGQRRHAGRPGRRRPRLPAHDAHRRHRHRRRARARAGRRAGLWPCAAELLDQPFDEADVEVVAGHAGPAYGVPHAATVEAIRLARGWRRWCSIRSIRARAWPG